MEEPNRGRPMPEQGRSSERRNGAFRVCTVDDFGGRRDSSKRKAGQMTSACQMCRSRKIKCVVNDPQQATCRPCQVSNSECRWDVVDGRKKPRTHRVSIQGHFQPLETLAEAGASLADSRAQGASSSFPRNTVGSNDNNIPDSHGANRDREIDELEDHGTSQPFLQDQLPGLASICETHLDPNELQGSQQFLAEFCPSDNTQMPQDWPDLQNFVLGLDFMGDGDEFFPQPDTNEATDTSFPDDQPRPTVPRPRVIRLRYYRRFGPTAVVPGLRRLSVVVDPSQDEAPEADIENPEPDFSPSVNTSSPASAASHQSKLFDKASGEPHPDIVPQILDTFFKHFGGHFPFLNPLILGGHLRSGEASSFLLNAIAALTIRFCSFEGPLAVARDKHEVPWRRGRPFLHKAKKQLVPLLSIPAPDVVAGLLILAWAEFGDNNEAGLWMFAGMAIRMAQDLGLHRSPETDIDPSINFHDHARPSPDGKVILTDEQSTIHQQKARLVMFWSVFVMDVCVSLVTGRPPTIRRNEIEVPIPTFNDMKLAQLDFDESNSIHNMIFPETVRFMLQYAEAVEALNQRTTNRSPDRLPASSTPDQYTDLSLVRNKMLRSYKELPQELVFAIENYKNSAARNQSGLFLMLHLFFYTFMALLSSNHSRDARQGLHHARSRRPSIGRVIPGIQEPDQVDSDEDEHMPQISTMACQKMVQMLTIAELVNDRDYLATPFTNHCFFVAASTILQSSESFAHGRGTDNSLHDIIAGNDYNFFHKKLQEQGRYFGAINSVAAILEQKQTALVQGGRRQDTVTVDDEDENAGMERVVGLRDSGMVNRYTIPQLINA